MTSLFTDVFRRADKNDDGKIDRQEFDSFFGDERITDAELANRFRECDEDRSNNIDHAELIKFFGQGIGGNYRSLFQSLETIHAQLGDALRTSFATHSEHKDAVALFKERFLLREIAHQLETLHAVTESGLRGVRCGGH